MKKVLLAGVLLLISLSAFATTREEIGKIRVGREGQFKYWDENSEVLKSLKDFVSCVTSESSDDFVPAEERVAVFDLDGTLICETAPTYFEWYLLIKRVFDDINYQPSEELYNYALEVSLAIANQEIPAEMDWGEAWAQNAAFVGMTLDEYADYVRDFSLTDVNGYNGMQWGEAFYLPMVEVVSYLAANDFKTYIVSGSERHLVRVLANGVLQIETNHIIGSDIETFATGQGDTKGMDYVFKETDDIIRGNLVTKNLKMNKVSSIVREIGIRPILAFGNSTGDFSMFQYTTSNQKRTGMAFCVLADDTVRENGNPKKAASIKDRCAEEGWFTISMSEDWKTIYGDDVERNPADDIFGPMDEPVETDAVTLMGTPADMPYTGIVIKDHKKQLYSK